MNWKTKSKKSSWKVGDLVSIKRFAWLPIPCVGGRTYWLTGVYYYYRAAEDTNTRPGDYRITYEYEYEPDGFQYTTPIRKTAWELEYISPYGY